MDGEAHQSQHGDDHDQSRELWFEGVTVAGEDVDDMWYYHRPGEEHDVRPDIEYLWYVDACDVVLFVTWYTG